MKILMINYEFPPLGGGAGNATRCLAREFVSMGHSVRVLTSGFRGLPRSERMEGYEVIRIPVFRRNVYRCSVFEQATFVLSSLLFTVLASVRFRQDVTLAFFGIPGGPAALLVRLLLGIPYVVSLRGGDVPGFNPRELAAWHRLTAPLIRVIWRQACAVVANSERLKQLARDYAPKLAVQVIPNGVETRESGPAAGRNPDEAFRLLSAGRMTSQKGFGELLEAFAELKKECHSPVELEIVGDGPLRHGLDKQARDLGLQECVRFSGWLDRSTLLKRYQAADVFVLCSVDEGMSNVIAEAMSCGLPVVATRVTGTEFLVADGESGYIVQQGNRAALVERLQRLVQDKMLGVQMGWKGRERVLELAWQNIAGKWNVLFCEGRDSVARRGKKGGA